MVSFLGMTTLQRLKAFIDFKGITNQKFEQSIGLSNGAFGGQLKNNRTIGVDKLEKIVTVYEELNPIWLLTGNGDMIRSTTDTEQSGASQTTFLDWINELKDADLSFEKRRQIADQILSRYMDLIRENSRLKSELIDSLRAVGKLL